MNCPLCAEEIKDAAILCRFCGATQSPAGQWTAPPARAVASVPPRGSTTIKFSGVLFILSSAVTFASLTSDVPLFGAMRGGVLAIAYNLFFALLFLGMGISLIVGRSWGYRIFLTGTVIYSLDRILFLLDKGARDASLTSSGLSQDMKSLVDPSIFDEGMFLASAAVLLCWWGFAFYIYLRRDYFQDSSA